MSEINFLIKEKLKKYPVGVQKLVLKAIELAELNHETAISDQLEGVVRDISKNNS